MSKISKKDESKDYNASCVSCGSNKNIQLWPHRDNYGNMIGFVFLCDGCKELANGISFTVHGIRKGDNALDGMDPEALAELIAAVKKIDVLRSSLKPREKEPYKRTVEIEQAEWDKVQKCLDDLTGGE